MNKTLVATVALILCAVFTLISIHTITYLGGIEGFTVVAPLNSVCKEKA